MREQDVITFQLILKELNKVGLSVSKFAQRINISRSTLYKYMTDVSTLTEANYIYILYQLKTKYPHILDACMINIDRPDPAPLLNIKPVYSAEYNSSREL